MNVDENLLAKQGKEDKRNDGSAGRAGDLREAQRPQAGKNEKKAGQAGPTGSDRSDENADFSEDEDESAPLSLREKIAAGKKQKGKEDDGSSVAGSSLKASAASKGSAELLKQSWLNLIPSWGLTLIWINIHVFLSQIFGKKAFCKLGDEWSGPVPGAAAAAKVADPKKSSLGNIGEAAGLAGCDGCCLFVFLAIIAVFVIVYQAISEPETAASLLGEGLWGLIQSIF